MLSHESIASAPNSRRPRRRVGRGDGSGHGSFSGRGCKGQNARSGARKFSAAFEGGQTPLFRRMPKKGFTAHEPINFDAVNTFDLQRLGLKEITPAILAERGLVGNKSKVKVLGNGELSVAVKVTAHAFSASAKAKIEAAGGTATVA